MNNFRRIKGNVVITVSGIGTERFINICKHTGIPLYDIRYDKDNCQAKILMSAADFKRIGAARKASRTHVRITDKIGVPFWMFRYRKRYFFAAGIILFLAINIVMSFHLWRIDVEGCTYYSEKSIVECIEEIGIKPGIRTSGVSCYQIESTIRKSFDKVTWVSAAVDGSRLIISIVENDDAIIAPADETPNDIVAGSDGVIESIMTRAGTPIVKAGDEVKAGDVLVMSKVKSLNESDECFNIRYVNADADVRITYTIEYSETIARQYDKKVYTGREKHASAIRLGNNVINYRIPECKSYENFDVFTTYSSAKLYDNMFLPVTYVFVTCKEYVYEPDMYDDTAISDMLQEKLQNYIENLQEKGIQTVSDSVKITLDENGGTASGYITVSDCRTVKSPPVINDEKDMNATE